MYMINFSLSAVLNYYSKLIDSTCIFNKLNRVCEIKLRLCSQGEPLGNAVFLN